MNRENFDFLYQMFPYHDLKNLNIIIVNQTIKDKQLVSEFPNIKVINSFEKGLSKSRNLALQNATANWCLIADDDLVYVKNFEDKIRAGIQKYSRSGMVIFQAADKQGELLRDYPKYSKNEMSVFEILGVGSIEILVQQSKVKNKVLFNENFGLGSGIFNSGEEQIFIDEVRQQLKLPISFYNKTIVQHPRIHTGVNYSLRGRYFTKGGLYAQLFPKSYLKWILTQLFFDVKQGHVKLSQIVSEFKEALQGGKQLKKIQNETN